MSLKGRYALISLLLALIVIVAAGFGKYLVTQDQSLSLSSIVQRTQISEASRRVQQAVWESRATLENFLLFPHDPVYAERFAHALQQAKRHSAQLQSYSWIAEHEYILDTLSLTRTLSEFEQAVRVLMEKRQDPHQQYPAFSIVRYEMFPTNFIFLNAVSMALQALEQDAITAQEQQAMLIFQQIRYTWIQMIADFRMFFANRIGSLDNEVLLSQEKSVDLLYQTLLKNLQTLTQLAKQNIAMGFPGAEFVVIMQRAAQRWHQSFKRVKVIHASESWRTDANELQNNVKPLLQIIWRDLVTLDKLIELSWNDDIEQLSQTTNNLVSSIYVLAFFGLMAIGFGFLALNRMIIIPLSRLTNAINSEIAGNTKPQLPNVSAKETRVLMDAFLRMRDQIRRRQADLKFQALHDGLTGLPNRRSFMDCLQKSMVSAKQTHTNIALIILDLNQFKYINDTLGHQMGDSLLQAVSTRLKHLLKKTDMVARLGGDEFAIIIRQTTVQTTQLIAVQIVKALEIPYKLNDQKLCSGASLGVAMYPDHGLNQNELIHHADIAMYTAKRNKLGFSLYHSKFDSDLVSLTG